MIPARSGDAACFILKKQRKGTDGVRCFVRMKQAACTTNTRDARVNALSSTVYAHRPLEM